MSSAAYEQKLQTLGRLVGELGLGRASQLTLLASDPKHGVSPAGTPNEREFLRLMGETLQDVATDRQRFTPHG